MLHKFHVEQRATPKNQLSITVVVARFTIYYSRESKRKNKLRLIRLKTTHETFINEKSLGQSNCI